MFLLPNIPSHNLYLQQDGIGRSRDFRYVVVVAQPLKRSPGETRDFFYISKTFKSTLDGRLSRRAFIVKVTMHNVIFPAVKNETWRSKALG